MEKWHDTDELLGERIFSAISEIDRLRAENEALRAGIINIRDRFNAFAATDTPLQHRYDQLANAIAAAQRGEGE